MYCRLPTVGFFYLAENKKMELDPDKLYYSISELAGMFDVSKSLIRFWENEFPSFRPQKTKKGDRRFTPKNIEQFGLIHQLVKERGFTLDGAKHEIKRQHSFNKERDKHIKMLEGLKEKLEEIKAFNSVK